MISFCVRAFEDARNWVTQPPEQSDLVAAICRNPDRCRSGTLFGGKTRGAIIEVKMTWACSMAKRVANDR